MKVSRVFLRLIGLGFIVVAIMYALADYRASRIPAVISVVEETTLVIETPMMDSLAPVATQVVAVNSPDPANEPDPVQKYVLSAVIDLGSGRSTTWSIRLPEGGELPGTWADAIAYADGDDSLPVSPFNAHKGTIYSLLGDTTVIRAHSGRLNFAWNLFASNLDLYLRMDSEGRGLSVAEGESKLQQLIGTAAYLCQSDISIEPFTVFDPTKGCPGEILELQLVAGAIVTREKVADYDLALLSLRSWMMANYPGHGFEDLDPASGFILITCVQKYADQPSIDGVYPIYNRVALGFRIVEAGR
jgi:hypothetical protein